MANSSSSSSEAIALDKPPPYVDLKGAAAYCGNVSTKSIARLVEAGRLTAYRPIKGRVLISLAELDALIRSSTSRPRSGRGRHSRPAAGA